MLRCARRPTCVSRALREIVRVGVCAACVSAVVVLDVVVFVAALPRTVGPRSEKSVRGPYSSQVKLYINNRQLDFLT